MKPIAILGVRLREEAERDLVMAASWYEEQRAGLGHEFLDKVLSVLRSSAELSVLPRIGLLETRIPEVPLLTCQPILRTRLKLVFDIEIETCAQCGGKVKVIASIEDPAAVP